MEGPTLTTLVVAAVVLLKNLPSLLLNCQAQERRLKVSSLHCQGFHYRQVVFLYSNYAENQPTSGSEHRSHRLTEFYG